MRIRERFTGIAPRMAAVVLDVVAVAVFCAIGRGSHGEAIVGGLLHTAWPFEAGLLVGWIVVSVIARRRALPSAPWYALPHSSWA